jgi:protein TonB
MDSLLQAAEHIERQLAHEPIVAPAAGSLLLHGTLAGAIVFYAVFAGLFHHNTWGDAASGGAIQVQLVSNALPLPAEQKPNDNVLATDTPSEAPAPPAPKPAEKAVDTTAIPIPGKLEKPKQETPPKTKPHEPPPTPDNRAKFGEQASSSMPRAMQAQTAATGPTSINVGDFGTRFGWYVDGINSKMANVSYRGEVDPRTPKGARVYIVFTIHRDGSPSDVQLDRSSGSPTLDRACERAVQRVDTFGQLPTAYNQNTLMVSHYCEY